MVRKLADSSPIKFKTEIDDIDGVLGPEFEINFYRVVQECLNNVVKHSGAKTTVVHLQRESRVVRLDIGDDGSGLSREGRGASAGLGLRNITERDRAEHERQAGIERKPQLAHIRV
jgi:signal transduction histidine kinase